MRIIILIALILFSSTFAFSNEAGNLIKQQKENKRKESEAGDKRKRDKKAREQCLDKVIDIIALKIKELMDKGVVFKKPKLYNASFEYIGEKRYAVYYDGSKTLVRTSMYEDRIIALQEIVFGEPWDSIKIYFQPENGHEVRLDIKFNVSVLSGDTIANKWELQIFVDTKTPKANRVIKFVSFHDINEIENKRDMINNNIVKAIEAAIKYGDK